MCYSWFSFDEAITFKLCFSIHSQTLLSKSNLWIFYLRKVSYKNIQGKRVVVPIHSGKDIKQGTLLGMIQDIDIDKETFFKLLQE